MNRFEDRLIGDLMEQHGPALAELQRGGPTKRSRRPLWLSGAVVVIAAVIATSVTLAGGGSTPAYAVTQNPNGTVTLTLTEMAGITGANAELRKMGLPVLVVSTADDCRDHFVYQATNDALSNGLSGDLANGNGQFTFSLDQIPAADTLVIGARPVTVTQGVPMPPKGGLKGVIMSDGLVKGRPPAC